MLFLPDESLKIQRVVANSMSRYTFTIVQPSAYGAINQEVSTGVGIKWRGAYLILTAGHVVEHCPEDTLRFFLPTPEIQFATGNKTVKLEVRRLCELEHPKPPVFAAGEVDLAAIVLPPQPGKEECFYALDDCQTIPAEGAQIGVFGYPEATKIPVGVNYMACPEHFFGPLNLKANACIHEPIRGENFAVGYEPPHGAKGFSGSGAWYWSSDPVWSPEARLVGIIATHCSVDRVVCGYSVATVIEFLSQEENFILAQ
jgi:hypothetical protein